MRGMLEGERERESERILCKRESESKRERSSCDISLWTDRYSNASGLSQAPSASCYFYQAFSVIPLLVHTDGARKGPCCSTYSKAAECSMAQQKPVCIPGINFLWRVMYI